MSRRTGFLCPARRRVPLRFFGLGKQALSNRLILILDKPALVVSKQQEGRIDPANIK